MLPCAKGFPTLGILIMSAQIVDITRGLSTPRHTGQEPQPEYISHIGSTEGSSSAAFLADLARLEELKGVELRSDNPDPDVLTVVVHDPDVMIGSYLDNVPLAQGRVQAVGPSPTTHVIGYAIEDVSHDRTTAEVYLPRRLWQRINNARPPDHGFDPSQVLE